MRFLGGAYAAQKLKGTNYPLGRVVISGHGIGGTADPITIDVDAVSVSRALRGQADSASFTVADPSGDWDPKAGKWNALIGGAGRVKIELGETNFQDGYATPIGEEWYWTVFTGSVCDIDPSDTATDSTAVVTLQNRVKDVWNLQVTSPFYGDDSSDKWEANDIVEDLFTRFAGMAAGDISLTSLSCLLYRIQFENESLMQAASSVLLPKGYVPYFGYDGKLNSRLLVPASWTSALTIPDDMIERIGGPQGCPPTATRIVANCGPEPELTTLYGDPEVWSTVRAELHWQMSAGPIPSHQLQWKDASGDAITDEAPMSNFWRIKCAGPREKSYRAYPLIPVACSTVTARVSTDVTDKMTLSSASVMATGAYVEKYNSDMLRQECWVQLNLADTAGANETCAILLEFDVVGYPTTEVYKPIVVQKWDDTLIANYGEQRLEVSAKCAQTPGDAVTVAETELTFAQKSVLQINDVTLAGLDLRIEPGDVITLERRGKANVDMWVQSVTHAFDGTRASTQLQGYAL